MTPHRTREQQADRAAIAEVVREATADPKVIQHRMRYELLTKALRTVVGVALVACLGLLIYLSAAANDAAEAVRGCTEPGGGCYQRSQAQSGALVAQIVQAQRDAVANGSVPVRENLKLTQTNAANIETILAILDRQYPDAVKLVRAELDRK